jgi:hypothetical protein
MEPRSMFLKDGKYYEKQLADGSAQEVKMTEAYMAQFKKDKKKFEMLQQFNRRTEGKVLSLDFDPAAAKPVNPDYLIFKKLPPTNK